MDPIFWHQKWENNQIAFHQGKANALLVKYFNKLSLPESSQIFVPLCGKTLDIRWLLSNGYKVAGAELNRMAVEQLFAELGVEPQISGVGELTQFSAENIDIFVGDIFEMSGTVLGPVDAVYDRAALVALPEEMRKRYAVHLMDITNTAPQLVICFQYDQQLMDGPPFSITESELDRLYGSRYSIIQIARTDVQGGLKGISAVEEAVWLLADRRKAGQQVKGRLY